MNVKKNAEEGEIKRDERLEIIKKRIEQSDDRMQEDSKTMIYMRVKAGYGM